MKLSLFTGSLVTLLVFFSCKKDVGAAADAERPVITVTSPTANQVFTGGQTVAIAGTITDNTKLKEVHLEIINNTTGVLLTHEHYVPGAGSYALSRRFTIPAAASYKIKIEAVDDSDNKAEVQLNVSAN